MEIGGDYPFYFLNRATAKDAWALRVLWMRRPIKFPLLAAWLSFYSDLIGPLIATPHIFPPNMRYMFGTILKYDDVANRIPMADVSSHSLRSGGATAL